MSYMVKYMAVPTDYGNVLFILRHAVLCHPEG